MMMLKCERTLWRITCVHHTKCYATERQRLRHVRSSFRFPVGIGDTCDVQFVHTAMRPLSAEVPRGRGCISLK